MTSLFRGARRAALALSLLAGAHATAASPGQDRPASTPAAMRQAGFGLPERDAAGLLSERPGTDWLVRQLQGDPAVVVIQFPTLQAQGRTLDRVAALLEKRGADRSRVLSAAELDAFIRAHGDTVATFYLGHDYVASGLARFFTAASRQRAALNPEERRLLGLLRQIGFLAVDGQGGFTAPRNAALVTFGAPQASDDQVPPDEAMDPPRRASILAHELSHGVYFTRAAYRAHCWHFWRIQLSDTERARWRHVLVGMGYDGRNEDLMVNETQALLMHTPDTRDFGAYALGIDEGEFDGMRRRFGADAGALTPPSLPPARPASRPR